LVIVVDAEFIKCGVRSKCSAQRPKWDITLPKTAANSAPRHFAVFHSLFAIRHRFL